MKSRNIFATTILLTVTGSAIGDSEMMPTPKVFASPSGSYYFKLVPSSDFDEKKAQGFLYQVTDGEDDLIYRSDGWYSFNVLVSHDGAYIARRGPWPQYNSPPETTPAVVFYTNGKHARTYNVSDLIDNTKDLPRSISHYSWGGELRWAVHAGPFTVEVRTVEDKVIQFDIRTARITN